MGYLANGTSTFPVPLIGLRVLWISENILECKMEGMGVLTCSVEEPARFYLQGHC